MDLGVVLQTTPPSWRVVELAKRAEQFGFSHVWTFDSHILWQEPYVIYSQILAETRQVTVGPMVTNPATRDWTVTASLFATLNEMYGNRTVCGIGRGDSAVRVTNGKPTTLATLRESIHVIRELANGRAVDYKGSSLRFPWAAKSRLDVWMAAYGPKALALCGRGGRRVHPAAGRSRHRGVDGQGRPRGGRGARAGIRPTSRSASPRRPTSVTTWPTSGTRPDGSAAWSATTWPTSSSATGRPAAGRRSHRAHRLHQGSAGLRLQRARPGRQPHTAFVPDEIVDRFCLLGPVDAPRRAAGGAKALGVDQFAIYLQHDGKDETLAAYGERVMPAIADHVAAKS